MAKGLREITKAESWRVQEQSLSDERLLEIIKDACYDGKGDCTVLESAIGALCFGREVGWHGLRTVHSSRTMRRYEGVLGVKFKDVLPDRTRHSPRLWGIVLADKFGKFWQAIAAGKVSSQEAKMIRSTTT